LEKAVLNFSFQIQQKALSKLSWLSTFKDVFLYDASPIRLPASLAARFPGNRSNHSPACFKLSALYKMSVRAVEWMKLTDQKTHDSQILPDLEQLKGSFICDRIRTPFFYNVNPTTTSNEVGRCFLFGHISKWRRL